MRVGIAMPWLTISAAAFEQAGFKKNVQKDIIVEVNQVVTLNSTLQIGQTQETVEVTSEAPQVDTTSTQLGAVINDRSVNELPLNARDTYQFLATSWASRRNWAVAAVCFSGLISRVRSSRTPFA